MVLNISFGVVFSFPEKWPRHFPPFTGDPPLPPSTLAMGLPSAPDGKTKGKSYQNPFFRNGFPLFFPPGERQTSPPLRVPHSLFPPKPVGTRWSAGTSFPKLELPRRSFFPPPVAFLPFSLKFISPTTFVNSSPFAVALLSFSPLRSDLLLRAPAPTGAFEPGVGPRWFLS